MTHASTGMSLVCCLLVAVTGYLTFTDKTQVPFVALASLSLLIFDEGEYLEQL